MKYDKYIVVALFGFVGLHAQCIYGDTFRFYPSYSTSAPISGGLPFTEFHSVSSMQGTTTVSTSETQQMMGGGNRYSRTGEVMKSTSAMPVGSYSVPFAAQDLIPQQATQPQGEAVLTIMPGMYNRHDGADATEGYPYKGGGRGIFDTRKWNSALGNQNNFSRVNTDNRYVIRVAALHLESVGEAVEPYSSSAKSPYRLPPLITDDNKGEDPKLPEGLPVGDALVPLLVCVLGFWLYIIIREGKGSRDN